MAEPLTLTTSTSTASRRTASRCRRRRSWSPTAPSPARGCPTTGPAWRDAARERPRPLQVTVDLTYPDNRRPAATAQLQRPCKHAIGLMLLAAHTPEQFEGAPREGLGRHVADPGARGIFPKTRAPATCARRSTRHPRRAGIRRPPAQSTPTGSRRTATRTTSRAEFIACRWS